MIGRHQSDKMITSGSKDRERPISRGRSGFFDAPHVYLSKVWCMSISVVGIANEQAARVVDLEEGQFADVKAIEITPAKFNQDHFSIC